MDLATGKWTVRTSLTWVGGVMYEHTPKNDERRSIPLPVFVVDALKAARRVRPFQTWIAEWPDVPGERVHVDCVSAYFRTLAARCGAPTGLHSLRRFLLTKLARTADLDVVARISGHKSIEVFRKHFIVERDDQVTAAMNNAFAEVG